MIPERPSTEVTFKRYSISRLARLPMSPIVILETDYETLDEAISVKEDQIADLTNQGIPFQQQTLYRLTDGTRVFLITPIEPELEAEQPRRTSAKPHTRRTSSQKRRERTQQVDYR